MPDKFEKEKIDVNFERVSMEVSLQVATRIRALRPYLTFRQMSIGVDPK